MVGPLKFRTGHASSRLLGGDPVKAYRKFKLPESVGPRAKVADPAKVLGPEPETLATLATLAAGNAQNTNFDGQLKDCAPLDPDEPELEERKGMAMDRRRSAAFARRS
jgi:Flp pilus assembly protein TadD